METGHKQPSFLKRKKKGFSLNCNIVLLPAAISLLSEGDIVCEPNWSFRRHLNPCLCSKSPPRTSDADFFPSYFLGKQLHGSFYGNDMRDDNDLDKLMWSIKVMKAL